MSLFLLFHLTCFSLGSSGSFLLIILSENNQSYFQFTKVKFCPANFIILIFFYSKPLTQFVNSNFCAILWRYTIWLYILCAENSQVIHCCLLWVVAWEKKKYNVPHSLQFSWQEKSILIIIGIFTNHLLRIFFQKEVVMLWVFMSSVFDVSIPILFLPENWYKFFSKSKDWYHVVLPYTLIWLMCNRFFILLNRWAFQ